MGQDDVEIILLKQLASCLRIPVALLGPRGNILFFNEPAEEIFDLRFEEVGVVGVDDWSSRFRPSDASHSPLERGDRPLMLAIDRRIPVHRKVYVQPQRTWQEIEVTAIPLLAIGNRFLGALGFFWSPGSAASAATPASRPPEHQAVETILTRRIASSLAAPVFLVDADGRLLYFNPAAEPILGQRFESATPLGSRRELYTAFQPRDEAGNPIAPDDHPLSVARIRHEPVHRSSWIRGIDGRDRRIAITAIPLIGQSDRLVAVFGVFWESDPP